MGAHHPRPLFLRHPVPVLVLAPLLAHGVKDDVPVLGRRGVELGHEFGVGGRVARVASEFDDGVVAVRRGEEVPCGDAVQGELGVEEGVERLSEVEEEEVGLVAEDGVHPGMPFSSGFEFGPSRQKLAEGFESRPLFVFDQCAPEGEVDAAEVVEHVVPFVRFGCVTHGTSDRSRSDLHLRKSSLWMWRIASCLHCTSYHRRRENLRSEERGFPETWRNPFRRSFESGRKLYRLPRPLPSRRTPDFAPNPRRGSRNFSVERAVPFVPDPRRRHDRSPPEHAYLAAEEFRASHPDAQIAVVDSTCATSRPLGETGRTRLRWGNAGRGRWRSGNLRVDNRLCGCIIKLAPGAGRPAELVKWYNGALVMRNWEFDSPTRHHT